MKISNVIFHIKLILIHDENVKINLGLMESKLLPGSSLRLHRQIDLLKPQNFFFRKCENFEIFYCAASVYTPCIIIYEIGLGV